jgi:uncharacterized protein YoxC
MNRKQNINYKSVIYDSNSDSDDYNNSDYDEILNRLLDEDSEEETIKQEQLKSKVEFNENLIEERNEEIQQIYKDVVEINEIFKDLNKLVHSQSESINKVEEQIEQTVNKVEKGVEYIKEAEIYHNSWLSKRNKIILLSIAGLSINIPITLTLGLKAGAISGLSTVGFGAITTLFSKK